MPKVFELDGYAVYVYTRNEHPPAHVHVKKLGTVIPVLLTLRGPVWRGDWQGRRPREREISRATEIVTECVDACIQTWARIHEAGRRHDGR